MKPTLTKLERLAVSSIAKYPQSDRGMFFLGQQIMRAAYLGDTVKSRATSPFSFQELLKILPNEDAVFQSVVAIHQAHGIECSMTAQAAMYAIQNLVTDTADYVDQTVMKITDTYQVEVPNDLESAQLHLFNEQIAWQEIVERNMPFARALHSFLLNHPQVSVALSKVLDAKAKLLHETSHFQKANQIDRNNI